MTLGSLHDTPDQPLFSIITGNAAIMGQQTIFSVYFSRLDTVTPF